MIQGIANAGLKVAELTGDTQLSKKELGETQMIVTTPEKWDVITRKGGDVSVAATVRLLIIDEVKIAVLAATEVLTLCFVACWYPSANAFLPVRFSQCPFLQCPSASAFQSVPYKATSCLHGAHLTWPHAPS